MEKTLEKISLEHGWKPDKLKDSIIELGLIYGGLLSGLISTSITDRPEDVVLGVLVGYSLGLRPYLTKEFLNDGGKKY